MVEQYLGQVLNGEADEASARELISDVEFRTRVASFRKAFPDLAVETRVLLAEGDLVAGHFVGRGSHQALFQGVPATGERWEAHCSAVYRVESGRIAAAWVNWDLLSLLEQLGAVERVRTVSA